MAFQLIEDPADDDDLFIENPADGNDLLIADRFLRWKYLS